MCCCLTRSGCVLLFDEGRSDDEINGRREGKRKLTREKMEYSLCWPALSQLLSKLCRVRHEQAAGQNRTPYLPGVKVIPPIAQRPSLSGQHLDLATYHINPLSEAVYGLTAMHSGPFRIHRATEFGDWCPSK